MKIIKKRKGNKGNTQWNVDYMVSNQGNVYITSIKCYNTFSEKLDTTELFYWLNEQYENIKKGSVIAPFNRTLCNLSYYCQSRLILVFVFLLLILLKTKFLLPVL